MFDNRWEMVWVSYVEVSLMLRLELDFSLFILLSTGRQQAETKCMRQDYQKGWSVSMGPPIKTKQQYRPNRYIEAAAAKMEAHKSKHVTKEKWANFHSAHHLDQHSVGKRQNRMKRRLVKWHLLPLQSEQDSQTDHQREGTGCTVAVQPPPWNRQARQRKDSAFTTAS